MEQVNVKLTFERGLMEYLEPSRVRNGFFVEGENWVPESDGSLRCRFAWLEGAEGSAPTTRACRGLEHFANDGGTDVYAYFCKDTGSSTAPYKLLTLPVGNLASGTWTTVATPTLTEGSGSDVVSHVNPVTTTVGLGKLYWSAKGMQDFYEFDGSVNSANAADRGGRAVLFFKNRLLTAGGIKVSPDTASATQPYRVWFSDLGATTFTDNNYFDISENDGEAIEAMGIFDNGVLIGKRSSLWYLQGSGPSSYQLTQLEGYAGCAPGRTIVGTPFGAVIVGTQEVFLWKGAFPEPITRPISSSYQMTGNYMSATYIDGKVYISDVGSGTVYVFDLENNGWSIEKVKTPTQEGPGMMLRHGEYLLMGPVNSTSRMIAYRSIPQGSRGLDTSVGTRYFTKTPEYWLASAAATFVIRHLFLRYRQRGGTVGETPLTVRCYINGELRGTQNLPTENTAGVYRIRLDFAGPARYVQFEFEKDAVAGEGSVTDIEEIELFYDEELPR